MKNHFLRIGLTVISSIIVLSVGFLPGEGLIPASAATDPIWTFVGCDGPNSINYDSNKGAQYPAITTFMNELYTIWEEDTKIRVKLYRGSGWIQAGTPGPLNRGTGAAQNASLMVYKENLYAAWNEYTSATGGTYQIHVDKFNGTTWTAADGLNGCINHGITAHAYRPSLAVYGENLYAAWSEQANSGINQIRVSKYDVSSGWTPVDKNGDYGINYNTNCLADYPVLAVYNNKLYAVWQEQHVSSGKFQVILKSYDGNSTGTWDLVDAGLNCSNTNDGTNPTIIEYNGALYCAWEEKTKTYLQIHVKKYDGLNWTYVKNDETNGWNYNIDLPAAAPTFCIFNRSLYVSWGETAKVSTGTGTVNKKQIRIAKYDSDTDTKIFFDGNISTGLNKDNTQSAENPRLAILSGDLCVAWQEPNVTGFGQLLVKKTPLPAITTSLTIPVGTYSTTNPFNITVNFSKSVTVTGTPYIPITLDTGGTVNAAYVSGSGTSALVFRYTVASGHLDTDGINLGPNPIIVLGSGGSIKNQAANLDADLNLNDVPDTSRVLVDGVAPYVSSITRQNPTDAISHSGNVTFRVTFTENVTEVSPGDFTLTATGTAAGNITSLSVNSGAVIDVTVSSISGNGTLSLDLKNSGTGIADMAGNVINGGFNSGETYIIERTAATPVFNPPGGTYNTPWVSITCATDGAAIYYTTDGSDPIESSALYNGAPILITGSATLKARAFLTGWSPSSIASQYYQINGTIIGCRPGNNDPQTSPNRLLTAQNFEGDLSVQYNSATLQLGKGKTGRLTDLWLYYPNLIGYGTGQIKPGSNIVQAKLVLTLKDGSGNTNKPYGFKIYRIPDPDTVKKGAPYFGSDGIRNGLDFKYRDHRPGMNIPWSDSAANISGILVETGVNRNLEDSFELVPAVCEAKGYNTIFLDVSASIQNWAKVNEAEPNQGWFLTIDTTATQWANGDQLVFYGGSADNTSQRPYLEITYLDGSLTQPNVVGGLSASQTSTQVALHWTNSGINPVRVVRKEGMVPGSPQDGVLVAETNTNATGLTDTGLTNGVIYYYAVFRSDNLRNYSRRAWVKATPGSGAITAPTGLTGQLAGNQLTLNWSNGSNADWLIIEKGISATGPWDKLVYLATDQIQYTLDLTNPNFQFTPNSDYYFRIEAVNSNNSSAVSNIYHYGMIPDFLPAPTDLTWQIISAGRVNLSWSAVTGVEGYKVTVCDANQKEFWSYSLAANATIYMVTGLNPGTKYLIKVAVIRGSEAAVAWTEPITTTADFKGGLL